MYSDWLRDPENTISSWQTRNRDDNRYGGAVLFNPNKNPDRSGDIISFSGLTEEMDEALSLVLGGYAGIKTPIIRDRVLEISGNHNAYNELAAAFGTS